MSARVKSILSGDTLILQNKKSSKDAAEKDGGSASAEHQLILAFIVAPRMSEPWGYEAREFLRSLLLAKPVNYKDLYESSGRMFGDVSSPIFQSLAVHVVAHGWAKIRENFLTKPGGREIQMQLQRAQEEAESQGLGIWSDKRPMKFAVLDKVPAEIYSSNRRIPAIVERVLSGDRIVLRAMLSDHEHFVGTACLAGVRTHAGTGSNDISADLLATRLLQRQNVRVMFNAPAPHNSDIPLVTLLHPQGDIALILVGSGLAEVPNVPQIGAERLMQLRNAQHTAEQKGLGIFQAAAQARREHKQTYSGKDREARILKVLSADTFVLDPNAEVVQLTSVRAPRRTEQIGDMPPGYFVNEAKEFTRKLLIGQTVRIQVDGVSTFPAPSAPATTGAAATTSSDSSEKPETRPLVTMSYGPHFSNNAALTIIKAGWATVTHHRRDDLARSPFYDELEAAQKSAESNKLGMFRSTDATKSRKPNSKQVSGQMVYASESIVRARGYLASLERKSKIPAIVDQVISAGRLRLIVPSENCTLVAVLDGVKVPRTSEPYGEEAMLYTLREWNQRDVQVSVRSVDKTGAFVTAIYLKSKELAHELLARGLASVHAGSANASGLRAEYDEIEEAAQKERAGMWAEYEPPSETDNSAAAAGTASVPTNGLSNVHLDNDSETSPAGAGPVQYRDAVLSYADPENVYVRFAPADAKFKQMQSDLKKFFTAASNTAARTFAKRPKRRDMVVLSSTFERALVTNMSRGEPSTFDVDLIDSGEQKSGIPLSGLLPLPAEFQKIPALSTPIQLKYVHRPVSLYTKRYLEFLKSLFGKAIVVAGDIIYTADSTNVHDSLNYRLVAKGLASVPQSQSSEEGAQTYLEAQQSVKEDHRGMWEYGDPREDDDM